MELCCIEWKLPKMPHLWNNNKAKIYGRTARFSAIFTSFPKEKWTTFWLLMWLVSHRIELCCYICMEFYWPTTFILFLFYYHFLGTQCNIYMNFGKVSLCPPSSKLCLFHPTSVNWLYPRKQSRYYLAKMIKTIKKALLEDTLVVE